MAQNLDSLPLPGLRITYVRSLGRAEILGVPPGPLKDAAEDLVSRFLSEHISEEVRPRMGSTHRRMQAYMAYWRRKGESPPRTLGDLRRMLSDAESNTRSVLDGQVFMHGGKEYVTQLAPVSVADTNLPGDPRSQWQVKLDTAEEIKSQTAELTKRKKSSKRRRPRTRKAWCTDLPQPCALRGRLSGIYLNAVKRGYQGSPDRWLRRSRTARKCSGWSDRLTVFCPNGLLFWAFSPMAPVHVRLSAETVQLTKQVLPDWSIRRAAHLIDVMRHNKLRAPRTGLKLLGFPSSPTLYEWWRECGGGILPPPPRRSPIPHTVWNGLDSVKSNLELNRFLVRRFIIGIRDDVRVPDHLIRNFTWSRDGFLTPHSLRSAHVVGFLLRLWASCPWNVFIRYGHRGFREILGIAKDTISTTHARVVFGGIRPSRRKRRLRRRGRG